jgi:hypothetical protein
MTVTGDGTIEGVPLTSARATFSTDGQFHQSGQIGLDAFGIDVHGAVDATAALDAGSIAGQITGSFSVAVTPLGATGRPGATTHGRLSARLQPPRYRRPRARRRHRRR